VFDLWPELLKFDRFSIYLNILIKNMNCASRDNQEGWQYASLILFFFSRLFAYRFLVDFRIDGYGFGQLSADVERKICINNYIEYFNI
jgi:hypothetical protein